MAPAVNTIHGWSLLDDAPTTSSTSTSVGHGDGATGAAFTAANCKPGVSGAIRHGSGSFWTSEVDMSVTLSRHQAQEQSRSSRSGNDGPRLPRAGALFAKGGVNHEADGMLQPKVCG